MELFHIGLAIAGGSFGFGIISLGAANFLYSREKKRLGVTPSQGIDDTPPRGQNNLEVA